MHPQVLPACDWCHAKKIKCDRKELCGACRDNSVNCTRNRPRAPRHHAAAPNDDRFNVLMQRLSHLEGALVSKSQNEQDQASRSTSESTQNPTQPEFPKSPSPTETRVSQTVQSTSHNNEKEDQQSPEKDTSRIQRVGNAKRRRVSVAPSLGSSTQYSWDDDSSTIRQSPLLRQAQRYLKFQRGRPEVNTTQERQWLFQWGLDLAESVDSPPAIAWTDGVELEDKINFYSKSMYPSPEFIYITLNGLNTSSLITQLYLYLGSHISRTTLERMELALVENTAQGHRRLEYIVCVNFWAYLVLTSLESDDSSTRMAQHLGGTRDRYFNNAKQALKRMSILVTPTVSLLQALVSGVMLFLDVGDFENCWTLSSAAYRACISLGGHFVTQQTSDPSSVQAREVRACLFNCYIWDKAFSINMDRPCSLSDLDFSIASLVLTDNNKAVQDICQILLGIAQAMDAIIRERRLRIEGDEAANKVKRLHAVLDSLKPTQKLLEEGTQSSLYQSDNFLRGEFMSMEFTYCSVRTALLSMIIDAKYDADTHRILLDSARQALKALKAMQDNTWAHFIRSKAFASSLTWTILIFPLSAFFVVFSNVIITADLGDLRLLKDVADGFSVISADAPSVYKIEDFCKRLVKLCFETITKPRSHSNAPSTTPIFSQVHTDHITSQAPEITRPGMPGVADMENTVLGQQIPARVLLETSNLEFKKA
ncbi:hypothetical protein EDB80DRAFT_877127 [Ilyonectria destructans]|nr:hypothetical protein EDB80DRAFT_877127 [Ilyonectria destructans]